jgi:hypothetical protein
VNETPVGEVLDELVQNKILDHEMKEFIRHPFLPENGPLSTAFTDPPEKNGRDITDRTKENHQEETVTSSWTQPKAVTYRVTTSKDPPRKESSCSRHGGPT